MLNIKIQTAAIHFFFRFGSSNIHLIWFIHEFSIESPNAKPIRILKFFWSRQLFWNTNVAKYLPMIFTNTVHLWQSFLIIYLPIILINGTMVVLWALIITIVGSCYLGLKVHNVETQNKKFKVPCQKFAYFFFPSGVPFDMVVKLLIFIWHILIGGPKPSDWHHAHWKHFDFSYYVHM